MTGINLLPQRSRRPATQERRFHLALAGTFFAGIAVVLAAGWMLDEQVGELQQRTRQLQEKNEQLDAQIRQSDALNVNIAMLKQRLLALEARQQRRNDAAELLELLAQQMPEHVYLRTLEQHGEQITLNGHAPSYRLVMQLLANLHGRADAFMQVALRETHAAANQRENQSETNRGHEFLITLNRVSAAPAPAIADKAGP